MINWAVVGQLIDKLHYTGATGPDPTRPDKVRGLCWRPGSGRVRSGPCSGNTLEHPRSTTVVYHSDRQALSTARYSHAGQLATDDTCFFGGGRKPAYAPVPILWIVGTPLLEWVGRCGGRSVARSPPLCAPIENSSRD